MLHQNATRRVVIAILVLCLLLGFAAMGFPGAVLKVPDVQGLKSRLAKTESGSGSGTAGLLSTTNSGSESSNSLGDGVAAAPTHFFIDTYSVFQYCRDDVCEYTTEKVITCTETVSKLRVQGAFLCIHCVAILVQIVVMVLEIKERYIPVRRLPYIMFAWVFVTILITWAVMVGTLNAKQCGASKSWKDDGAETGDAFPILLVDFVFAIIAIVIYTVALNIPETDSNNDLWMKLGGFGKYMMRRNGTLDGSTELGKSIDDGGGGGKGGRAKSIIITRKRSEIQEAQGNGVEEPLLPKEAKSTTVLIDPPSSSSADTVKSTSEEKATAPIEIFTASSAPTVVGHPAAMQNSALATSGSLGESWHAGNSAGPLNFSADSPAIEALDLPPANSSINSSSLGNTVTVEDALDISGNKNKSSRKPAVVISSSGGDSPPQSAAAVKALVDDDEPEDLLPPPQPTSGVKRPGGAPKPSSMLVVSNRPGGAPLPSGNRASTKIAPSAPRAKKMKKVPPTETNKPINPLPLSEKEPTATTLEANPHEESITPPKETVNVGKGENTSEASGELRAIDSDEELLSPRKSAPKPKKRPVTKPKLSPSVDEVDKELGVGGEVSSNEKATSSPPEEQRHTGPTTALDLSSEKEDKVPETRSETLPKTAVAEASALIDSDDDLLKPKRNSPQNSSQQGEEGASQGRDHDNANPSAAPTLEVQSKQGSSSSVTLPDHEEIHVLTTEIVKQKSNVKRSGDDSSSENEMDDVKADISKSKSESSSPQAAVPDVEVVDEKAQLTPSSSSTHTPCVEL